MTRVATITLNPAYDLVGFCAQIKRGNVNQVQTRGLYAAGKGINVASVLNDLGMEVCVGGFLGEENQQGFLQLFRERQISNRFLTVDGRTRINVKLTEAQGVVTDINFSGFTVSDGDWQRFTREATSWLPSADIICISGSLPQGITPQALRDWMTQLTETGACLVFDSSGDALMAGLQAKPWLVKPNRHELEQWAGKPLSDRQQVHDAAYRLLMQGITHVVVSLGEEGALWVSESASWLARPPACEVISTVGAGDSMVAGLIYGLLMRQPVEHSLRLATAVAALAVSQSNVGVGDRCALAAMMSQVELESLQ